jgi:hypothetical protein
MSHVDAIAVLLESCEAIRHSRLAGAKGIKRGPFRANPPNESASPLKFTRKKSSVRRATAITEIFRIGQAQYRAK